jgi:energy-converting hydrogenase Eha subunit C
MNDQSPVHNVLQKLHKSIPTIIIIAIGFTFLFILETWARPYSIDGIYFQQWTSEDMMQTASITDLHEQPWESLFYLHIQPPLLDGIRAVLAQLWSETNSQELLVFVDQGLYMIWMIVFGLMGAVIFRWIEQLTQNAVLSFFAAIFWFLHPAAIFYSTFLEGTLLTSAGILLLYYELWKASKNNVSIFKLVGVFILLFSIRSIFQWHSLIVICVSLILLKIPYRKILAFAAISGTFIAVFLLKQYLLFGIVSTSSFSGSSCLHSLSVFPIMEEADGKFAISNFGPIFPYLSETSLPNVLSREIKLTGIRNFNYYAYLPKENQMLDECIHIILSQPISKTLLSYLQNIFIFFQPSSQYYTAHSIVDRLPWRSLYDKIFSNVSLFLMLSFSASWWLARNQKQDLLLAGGMILPGLFVFASVILFEKYENMRYKFFLEPVFYVFIISNAYSFIKNAKEFVKVKISKNINF